MISFNLDCAHPTDSAIWQSAEERLRREVRSVLSRLQPGKPTVERRRSLRVPFPFLMRLQPVAAGSLKPLGCEIVVVGKDVSEAGLGFFHDAPLPFRFAVVTIESPEDCGGISVLVDLSWCRFNRYGWYENGGRFLQVVEPLAA
jgi:hypothetical protein